MSGNGRVLARVTGEVTLDNVNAMLSFVYSLLAGMCGTALEAVGLDPYVGFFHTDRL